MKNKIIISVFLAGILFLFKNLSANPTPIRDVKQVYTYYAVIDHALTLDDAKTAKNAAADLVNALQGIKDSEAALKAATAINATNNLDAQRRSFAMLTIALNNIFKTEKPGKMLYIHYCPMVKAYWMDESKDIANPYLGQKMPTCGKTTGMIM